MQKQKFEGVAVCLAVLHRRSHDTAEVGFCHGSVLRKAWCVVFPFLVARSPGRSDADDSTLLLRILDNFGVQEKAAVGLQATCT